MILVVGDYMIDRYWFGEVSRISPEAPVPVVKINRIEDRDGAAANVTANCKAMGAEVVNHYGAGEPIVKIRVIGKNQQVARVDFDHPQEPIQTLGQVLEKINIIIFSDYGKGALSNIDKLIQEAKDRGIMILVDPKGHDYSRYKGADVVKPNADEMREMVGGWGNEEELRAKATKLMQESQIRSILLTRAAEGMTLFTKNTAIHIPSTAREVYDVSGAGDTAIAALAVCLDKGYSLEDSARIANRAAGLSVAKFGTSLIHEHEIFN